MATYRFSFPTSIEFGPGVRARLGDHLKAQGLRRPLVVTDAGVAKLPMCGEIRGILERAGLKAETFAGVSGNPVKSQVTSGVDAFKRHDADSIVGLGGGAALDVAKAIALMATHPGDLFDYEDEKPGARPVSGPIPYWVALPTTSGTGSEVGRSAVVSDDVTHVKKIIFDPKLLARTVFADPELTLGLPPEVTAWTGFDALTHCVESYLARGYHPICDGVALEGARLCAQTLVTAVTKGADLEARGSMMMASMMGAIAFQKGLGVTHSCAHALGTVADMHHGRANAIMIPYALKMNVAAVPERFRTLALTVGLREHTGAAFLAWLVDLRRECGIDDRLAAAGVRQDRLDALVAIAVGDACHQNNPTPCTREDFVRIFNEAM